MAHTLGFQTDWIIVTGQATGGNLRATLFVKLCMDGLVDVEGLDARRRLQYSRQGSGIDDLEQAGTDDSNIKDGIGNNEDVTSPFTHPSKNCPIKIHLPGAIILCCPALSFSLRISPSRVIGTHDPVLPTHRHHI